MYVLFHCSKVNTSKLTSCRDHNIVYITYHKKGKITLRRADRIYIHSNELNETDSGDDVLKTASLKPFLITILRLFDKLEFDRNREANPLMFLMYDRP